MEFRNNMKNRILKYCLCGVLSIFISACGNSYESEFSTEPSVDGETYILVKKKGSKLCSPLLVNGEVWKHPANKPVLVSPGLYHLNCKLNVLEIEIKKGYVLHYESKNK